MSKSRLCEKTQHKYCRALGCDCVCHNKAQGVNPHVKLPSERTAAKPLASPKPQPQTLEGIYDCSYCEGERKLWNPKLEEYEQCPCVEKLAAIQAYILTIIGEDERHVRVRKPTHGSCCTCQTCGLPHDECKEVDMEYRNELRAEQRQRLMPTSGK